MTASRWIVPALIPALSLLTGCSSLSQTERGAVGGGAIGGLAGAAIGSATKHTAGGALIGTALGAAAGGLIGNDIEKTEKKHEQAVAQVAANQQAAEQARSLGMTDIAKMAQEHISDDIIIGQIRSSRTVYTLSAADISYLKSQGVSDAVVLEMQATARRVPQRVYVQQPEQVRVIHEYAPPPPPAIGFRYTYVR